MAELIRIRVSHFRLLRGGFDKSAFRRWWAVKRMQCQFLRPCEEKNEGIQNVVIVGTGVIGASGTAFYLSRGFSLIAIDSAPYAEVVFASMLTKPGKRSAKTACLPALRMTGRSFAPSMAQARAKADFVQENGGRTP